MLKVLSNILCDLDPKVKVIGQKAGICHISESKTYSMEFKDISTGFKQGSWSKIQGLFKDF